MSRRLRAQSGSDRKRKNWREMSVKSSAITHTQPHSCNWSNDGDNGKWYDVEQWRNWWFWKIIELVVVVNSMGGMNKDLFVGQVRGKGMRASSIKPTPRVECQSCFGDPSFKLLMGSRHTPSQRQESQRGEMMKRNGSRRGGRRVVGSWHCGWSLSLEEKSNLMGITTNLFTPYIPSTGSSITEPGPTLVLQYSSCESAVPHDSDRTHKPLPHQTPIDIIGWVMTLLFND